MKALGWIGRAKEDLLACPDEVVREVGHALYIAQLGSRHSSAKTLKGFGGASVVEIVENHDGNTYRAIYTVRFANVVYVLHAFQKKSKSGIATPMHEIARIRMRLKQAEEEYEIWRNAKR
ncbi:MAG: type II toxin-antitoxin system RelE/ParE family toxin [Rhizomicrobium sp.]